MPCHAYYAIESKNKEKTRLSCNQSARMYTQPMFVCHVQILRFVHTRLFIAAEAPAVASSGRARGRLLLPGANTGPLTRLLAPWALIPLLISDCLREAAFVEAAALAGLAPVAFCALTDVPFLKLVAGGSGSGLLLPEGIAKVGFRLIGESFRADMRAVGMEDFCPVRNSCLTASSGFIRLSGSQRRQRAKKSRKGSSSVLRTC